MAPKDAMKPPCGRNLLLHMLAQTAIGNPTFAHEGLSALMQVSCPPVHPVSPGCLLQTGKPGSQGDSDGASPWSTLLS